MCGLTGAVRGNQHFAQQALDVIFLRVAHAAERQHRGMTGLERELAGQILAGIGFDAAFQPLVEQRRGLHHHQVGGLELRPAFGERVLDALVHADRPVEHDALARVARGARDRSATDADRLGGDQHALGVQTMQQNLEALALGADAVLFGTHRSWMNSMFESTACRPILWIRRTSILERSRSV